MQYYGANKITTLLQSEENSQKKKLFLQNEIEFRKMKINFTMLRLHTCATR